MLIVAYPFFKMATTSTCTARVTRAQRTSTTCSVNTGVAAPRVVAARPARSSLGGVALPVRTRRAPTLVARAEPESKGEPEVRARSRLRPSSHPSWPRPWVVDAKWDEGRLGVQAMRAFMRPLWESG